jgi:small-conductance mechanosensitive channel
MIDLPFKALLLITAINLLILFGLRITKRYLFVFIKSEKWNAKVKRAWPKIHLIIWLMAWVLSIIYLLNQSFLVTGVMLALVILLGGKYWRDVVSGITLKLEDRVSVGDFLTKQDYEGVVEELGIRGMLLRIKNGENAFIPYRDLTNFRVRKLDRGVKNELNTVVVKFLPALAMDIAIEKLRNEILLIPYTILTQPVQIEVEKVSDSGTTLRAVLHTQSHDTGKLAEKALLLSLHQQNLIVTK